jgi:hypothetical protein
MKSLTVFSPTLGDVTLTAALLAQILGGEATVVETAITTVGNGTLTAAALVGGQIARTGPTAAYTDTTDTAVAIAALLGPGFTAGEIVPLVIKNATAFPQTLAGGTGVTLPATVIVPPFSVGAYYGTLGGTSAAPTVAYTHISTVPLRVPAEVSNPQAAALATVGAGTILPAAINAGVLVRTGSTSAFTDTTDTAANIVAGVSALLVVGQSVFWTYVNNTVAPATVAGGTGVTVSGATVVPPNSWVKYLVTLTAAATITMVAVEQGYFAASGTFVCNGVTPVTVTDAHVTATSNILVTLKTVGGTVGAIPAVKTITPGTGFTIAGTASDTSTYSYEIRG